MRTRLPVRIINEDGELERRCPRCGEYWPEDAEFFRRSGERGFDCYCKDCRQHVARAFCLRHQVNYQAKSREYHRTHPKHREVVNAS